MGYIQTIYDYFDAFLNFIYPRNIYCILCNNPIYKHEKYSLCSECKNKLKFIDENCCQICGKPLDELYLIDRCHECIDSSYFFAKAFSCVIYDDLSKKLIYDLKYYKKRYISYHIGEIIYDRLRQYDDIDFDIIIPAPLHKEKERERAFNQANLIGKYISKMTSIKVDSKSLIRMKNTITQNKLTREERKRNLENAFEVVNREAIQDKKILLIDDIFTTGATVNECSRILLENGATKVYVATFATGRSL